MRHRVEREDGGEEQSAGRLGGVARTPGVVDGEGEGVLRQDAGEHMLLRL